MSAPLARLGATKLGVLKILTGTAGGQAIGLLAAPVLSRLYRPEDFGTLAVVSAFALIIGPVAALRFDSALPIPRKESQARQLLVLGGASILAVSALSYLVVFVCGGWIVSNSTTPHLATWLWLAPAIGGCIGANTLLTQYAIRHRRYSAIARRSLLQWASLSTAQVGFGLAGLRPAGLMIGLATGHIVSAASFLPGSGLFAESRSWRSLRPNWRTARRYKRFPLILAPAGLINALGLQAPVLLLATLYGSQVAGWFGMTQRILTLPIALVGSSVAQVFLAEFARLARDRPADCLALFNRTSRRLVILGVVAAASTALVSPWIFPLVLGDAWTPSGVYSQAMAVALLAQLVAFPVGQAMAVLEAQLRMLGSDVFRLLVTTAAIYVSWILGATPAEAVWVLGLATTAAYTLAWVLARQAVSAASTYTPRTAHEE